MEVWITKPEQREKYYRYLPGILLEAVLILLVNGCGTLVLLKMLVPSMDAAALLLSTFCTAFLCLLAQKPGRSSFGIFILLSGIIAFLFVIFFRPVLAGFLEVWNQIAATLGEKAGIYLRVYRETASASIFSQRAFLVFLGILLGVLGYLILKFRWYLALFIISGVLPVFMSITGLVPDTRSCGAFYLAVLVAISYMTFCQTGKADTFWEIFPFLCGILFLTALVLIGGWMLQRLLPKNQYQDSQLVVNAKEEALESLSHFRYQGQKANSLPDGNLKAAGSWRASSDTALEVTMEQPSSLYLRGFVGSVYDGSSWESISPEDAYQEKDLFYWLHQDGFYGETQLAASRDLVEDTSLSREKGSIAIQNKTASSKYLYTPYELTDLPEGYAGVRAQADSTLNAKGIFGKRNYSFTAYGNLVKDFTFLGAEVYQVLTSETSSEKAAPLAEGQNERELANGYRRLESYYNALVYQYDTKLPKSLENLFRQELGDGGNREEGHTDYYTAITRIRAYLEKNMTYSTQTEPLLEDTDFTENFLETTKIGHSVHFATAAALMFRYYGIPSRYVEGYLITPEDVSGKKSGDSIEIPGSNGHAWTEIYVDGLGWIPLEMTPAYYQVMDEADLKTGLEAKGSLAASALETQEESPAKENIRTNWSLKLALFGIEKFILLFLMVFDLICFCFILTVFALRMAANRKRRKQFLQEDSKRAVQAMAGYADRLYEHNKNGYSEETQKYYEEIKKIGRRAAFSQHPVSPSQRRDVAGGVKHLLFELKRSTSWYQKWIMKYIERLY